MSEEVRNMKLVICHRCKAKDDTIEELVEVLEEEQRHWRAAIAAHQGHETVDIDYGSAVAAESRLTGAIASHGTGELARLREALDGMLDWALSNRGTEHEFVTCRSAPSSDHPALSAARAALGEE